MLLLLLLLVLLLLHLHLLHLLLLVRDGQFDCIVGIDYISHKLALHIKRVLLMFITLSTETDTTG